MANVTLFDQTGKQAGEVVLNDAIFGIEPNQSVVFDVIIGQHGKGRADGGGLVYLSIRHERQQRCNRHDGDNG